MTIGYVNRSMAISINGIEQRSAINKASKDVMETLYARYVVEGKSEPWSTVAAAVNGVIKTYNDLVAAWGSRKDAEMPRRRCPCR